MIKGPARHKVRVADDQVHGQRWLAIKYKWEDEWGLSNPQKTLQQLRVLSHTCRSLRAYALPLLWGVVHVDTLDELGRLRDAPRGTTNRTSRSPLLVLLEHGPRFREA